MQASFFGKRGILSKLSRILHLESGILYESGLSFDDDGGAAFSGNFVLAFFLFRDFYEVSVL